MRWMAFYRDRHDEGALWREVGWYATKDGAVAALDDVLRGDPDAYRGAVVRVVQERGMLERRPIRRKF